MYPSGYPFISLVIRSGALITVQGSNPLEIRATEYVTIAGLVNVSGNRGGNSAGNHMAAGGGAGGGAIKVVAPTITITATGAIHADGGDGGDAGGAGQGFFANPANAGDGSGGVGRAGGHNGGGGGTSGRAGNAGSGPGASAAGRYHGGVPPGASGAGYATAGCVLLRCRWSTPCWLPTRLLSPPVHLLSLTSCSPPASCAVSTAHDVISLLLLPVVCASNVAGKPALTSILAEPARSREGRRTVMQA